MRTERRNTGRAVIAAEAAAEAAADMLQGYSQHLHMPEGCIRHGGIAAELGHSGDNKTATGGHSRRRRAAERGLREQDTSHSQSIRASSTKTGEPAGGHRVCRWSGRSVGLADHATGVDSGDYTTWCLI